MKIQAIKSLLPRKLFGRTILIFLFPIILIELVVFVAFIQRHFEQVTSQMSEVFSYQVKFLLENTQNDSNLLKYRFSLKDLGNDFGLNVDLISQKPVHKVVNLEFFDFSGKTFVNKMTENFGNFVYFDFSQRREITFMIPINEKFLTITFPRSRISAANPHQLLVLMVFVSILLVFLSLVILRNQIKPIIKLAEVAEAFGKGQSLAFKPAGSEEVRRAGLAFLSMRGRIERQIEQRTQMLSGVSHDLRTPLTRLKLSLALSQNKNEAEEMLNDVNSMQAMLDEFLAFAKTDTLEEVTNTDLVRLIENIVEKNMQLGKSIKLVVSDKLSALNHLPLRKNIFARAIQNLINNSLNFGTQILLKLDINSKFIIILVEDNGPGILKEQRLDALKPFTRLDQSRNQNSHSGVGLGLSITLDTVRSHGGSLTLERSKDLGGLKVKITLPL